MLRVATGLLLGLASVASHAERSAEFGEYVVHYNAFNASVLQPEVAQQHKIVRSRHSGLVNVAVLKKVMGTPGEPVPAAITGTVTNLSQQQRALAFHEVREGNAIYYLAPFRITNEDTLDFALKVQPENQGSAQEVRFRQQFFTE
jgi:hypothetical protein